ncbi:MAG: hypothetical protein PHV51_00580 [Methanosarcinaceae archaeon]|nr:hypothetical protein [Methanosarcinaceae archaeon]
MNHNEYDFDTEIRQYLAEKGYVRRRQLIEDLKIKHKNERGYSLKSINRKLDNLINQGMIIRLKYPDLKKRGIEETDKRSIYLTLKNISKIVEHLDNVLERLGSEDPLKQKMAIKELSRYEKQYVLTPKKLDYIILQFYKYINKKNIDNELVDRLLLLLNNYVLKKRIEPTDKTKMIKLLTNLLTKYPVPTPMHKNLRTHIIHILGYYEHEAIIERFIEDARTLKDLHSLEEENVYTTEYTANVIEEHRKELFKLEEELTLEGKSEAAQFVSNVRTKAMIILGLYDNPFRENGEVDF